MALSSGTRLGTYEVVELIGSGGMGEVYRARDARLNRDVAIKILPEHFAADADRVARFQREAQVLASLNHPHIAQIYGIEEASPGVRALVLELVDGPTLADVIANGPIAVEEALPIARQIAEALEAAHEHGVIHRDLKPANIKLTHDGIVKVLDFGLAKALEPNTASAMAGVLSHSPTITSPAMTLGGVILGTAAYMSPEQAKGRPVDRRSDMWAFGCVLFEMLTGKRAFEGEDVSDILAEILKSEPDWKQLRTDLPPAIARLLRRCLAKDRKARLSDAGSAVLEITEALTSDATAESSSATSGHARRKWSERVAWIAATFGVLSAAVLVSLLYQQPRPQAPQAYRLSILPPANVRIGWAAGFGANRSMGAFALSPDGQNITFLGTGDDAKTVLWVRRLDNLTARVLPGTEGATGQFWSPDSRTIAFFADGKLKKIELNGGAPLTLCDAPPNSHGSWSSTGDIVFGALIPRGAIKRVSSAGGTPTDVTRLTEKGIDRHGWPLFLPDGRHFLYLAITGDGGAATRPAGVFAAAIDSAEQKQVLETGSNVDYSHGRLLFLRENVLMAQPFEPRRLELTGEPTPVAEGIALQQFMSFIGTFSASPAGLLAYQTATGYERTQLAWFDRSGKPLGDAGTIADFSDPELSPDGQRIAVSVLDPARRTKDIWVYPARNGTATRLTLEANALTARWSPDGTDIFFSSTQKGQRDLYRKSAGGAGADTVVLADAIEKQLSDVSRDGRYVLIQSGMGGGGARLFVWPVSGEAKLTPLGFPKGNEYWGRFSPDGKWIAYYSDASGRREVWVTRFPLDGSRWQLTTSGAWYPRWRRDGRELFYLGFDNAVYAMPVNGEGAAFQFGAPKRLFAFNPRTPFVPYDVTADGQRFIVSNLIDERAAMPITVLVNWTAGLKTRD